MTTMMPVSVTPSADADPISSVEEAASIDLEDGDDRGGARAAPRQVEDEVEVAERADERDDDGDERAPGGGSAA